MSYNRSIPQPTDLISNSQSALLGNFQAIDSGTTGTGIGFSRNHVTMTDATNGGLHNRVDFYQDVADPSISGFVGSLYTKSANGSDQLFYRNGAAITQITGIAPVASGSGAVPLAGGMIMMWNNNSVSTGSGTAISFPNGGFPNNCFSVVISNLNVNPSNALVQVKSGSVSNTGFTVITQNSNTAIYYIAIGN